MFCGCTILCKEGEDLIDWSLGGGNVVCFIDGVLNILEKEDFVVDKYA